VQLATFGRELEGRQDSLPGYARSMVEIADPDVIAASGATHHPIVAFTGNPADSVEGMVFSISETELAAADDYEVDDYKRVAGAIDLRYRSLGLHRCAGGQGLIFRTAGANRSRGGHKPNVTQGPRIFYLITPFFRSRRSMKLQVSSSFPMQIASSTAISSR
jgi:hypothetical protein